MPRYSKSQTRTKPQGSVKMPVPISGSDERRWRSQSTLGPKREGTPKIPKTAGVRIARMEKRNPRV